MDTPQPQQDEMGVVHLNSRKHVIAAPAAALVSMEIILIFAATMDLTLVSPMDQSLYLLKADSKI